MPPPITGSEFFTITISITELPNKLEKLTEQEWNVLSIMPARINPGEAGDEAMFIVILERPK